MTDTSVELCGLKLDNPVVPASGLGSLRCADILL